MLLNVSSFTNTPESAAGGEGCFGAGPSPEINCALITVLDFLFGVSLARVLFPIGGINVYRVAGFFVPSWEAYLAASSFRLKFLL